MKKKRHLKKKYKIIIILFMIIIPLLLWSRYVSTTGLIIKEYKVSNNNLPATFDGLKIVHFTDVHYGRTTNKKELNHLVNEINSLKPDLIFFTGDLIDKDIKITKTIKDDVTNTLKKLTATFGKYAVSGNHDLVLKDYKNILKNSGFVNLDNDYDIIYSSEYETIYIAGLESEIKGHPNIKKAAAYLENKDEDEDNPKDVPKYKILILHTPDTISKIKNHNFDLVLAGHSHNGQIRLPFIGSIVSPNGAKKYNEPYYKIKNNDLYISGGVGTSNMNFRFFNKPSFNFYRLVKK